MPAAKVLPNARVLFGCSGRYGDHYYISVFYNGKSYLWNEPNWIISNGHDCHTHFSNRKLAVNRLRRIRRAGILPPTDDLSSWLGKVLRPHEDKSFFPPGTKGRYSTLDYGDVMVTRLAKPKPGESSAHVWLDEAGRTWRCQSYDLKIVSIGGQVEQEDEVVW